MVEVEKRWKKRIKAPIGVYVWSVIVILKFGIFNGIGFFISARNADGEIYLPVVVTCFALSVFTAGAAVWAMTGDNTGRIAMLILTPLNIVWLILILIPVLSADDKEEARKAVGNIIGQVFTALWVIGMEWYFMTSKVVAYYKQDD